VVSRKVEECVHFEEDRDRLCSLGTEFYNQTQWWLGLLRKELSREVDYTQEAVKVLIQTIRGFLEFPRRDLASNRWRKIQYSKCMVFASMCEGFINEVQSKILFPLQGLNLQTGVRRKEIKELVNKLEKEAILLERCAASFTGLETGIFASETVSESLDHLEETIKKRNFREGCERSRLLVPKFAGLLFSTGNGNGTNGNGGAKKLSDLSRIIKILQKIPEPKYILSRNDMYKRNMRARLEDFENIAKALKVQSQPTEKEYCISGEGRRDFPLKTSIFKRAERLVRLGLLDTPPKPKTKRLSDTLADLQELRATVSVKEIEFQRGKLKKTGE
jgi:hypothetical protein